jgi:alkanesulfonate monooxygenase SsuD/methylene tetrahydromethanopterin reductase-like flavin-dependent oxidoreductase (luciferase family)
MTRPGMLGFRTAPIASQGLDWPTLDAIWAEAGTLDAFSAGWMSDHLTDASVDRGGGAFESLTTAAALAHRVPGKWIGIAVLANTFRYPAVVAKAATVIDNATGGRFILGLGAGWHEGEHRSHGFPFDTTRDRFDRLAEQFEILHRSWTEGAFDFSGRFYRLEGADPLPKPVQSPHPPLIAGGSARPRGAALAARWADEYNTVGATADECRERRQRIAEACAEQGRDPIPFSLMTGFLVGRDDAELRDRAARLALWRGEDDDSPDALPPAWLVGTPPQIVERIHELQDAGVERVMLQHLLHEDLDALELIGEEVIPAVR